MRRSHNVDEALDFSFDLVDENQGNILDNRDTSSSESKNKEDNLMVNIPPLDETFEELTLLSQDRQKQKQTKGPINSLETSIEEHNYENYVPSIPKNSIQSEIDKVLYRWEKSAVQKKVAKIIPALLKFGSSL